MSIDSVAVDSFIDKLLSDPNTNVYLIPDSVERLVYTNVLKLILHSLQKTLDSTHLDFLGHEIRLTLVPKQKEKVSKKRVLKKRKIRKSND